MEKEALYQLSYLCWHLIMRYVGNKMNNTFISDAIVYVGANDHEIDLFVTQCSCVPKQKKLI